MSKRKNFLDYIKTSQDLWEREAKMREIGMDLGEFFEDWYELATHLKRILFTQLQNEIIDWWLYEDVEKVIYEKEPGKKTWQLDTPEQLWDYLVTECGVTP